MAISFLDKSDFEFENTKVFCRVDFNIPLTAEGLVADDTRIAASIPTIKFLLEKKACVILASHLGRPKGKTNESLSLMPVAVRLQTLINQEIIFAHECVGDGVNLLAHNLKPGQIMLLENLRFHDSEEKNDPAFARDLAKLADVYVNDAFASVHRAHASVAGITNHIKLPLGGLLLKTEIEALERLKKNPKKPFVAILGGAKVSDKIAIINRLMRQVDKLIIGGAMAYTFLKAKGEQVGASRVEEDRLNQARMILQKAQQNGVEVILPVDHLVGREFSREATPRLILNGEFNAEDIGLDIGEKTRELFAEAIPNEGTVFWNGPLGVCEWEQFAGGTRSMANVLAESKAYTVVGGGDSVRALKDLGVSDKISYVSTGGGASLEFLQDAILPGLKALGYYEP